jgi:uncharacterized protein (DUF2267 family)
VGESLANSNDDTVEKLAALARLHTDGALSDDEFQTLKARLISQASKDVESEISKLVRETYGDEPQNRVTTEKTAFASDQADAFATTHAENSHAKRMASHGKDLPIRQPLRGRGEGQYLL